MIKTEEPQRCFVPKGSKVRLCNAVDLHSDGQLWATKSGKWIPVPLETETAQVSTSAVSL
jgi:hypothetical protein